MSDAPEPPVEVRRNRRFLRRELWFVVAAIVLALAVGLFASRRTTRLPERGAPVGSMNPVPSHEPPH